MGMVLCHLLLPYPLGDPVEDFLELFLSIEIGVVEDYGVVCLAQGAFLAVAINVVAELKVGHDLFYRDVWIGLVVFFKAALYTDVWFGGHEYLQLGVGEYHSAYVTAVHYYASLSAHLLLLTYGEGAHFFDGGYLTYFFSYDKVADVALDVLFIQVNLGLFMSFIVNEREMDIG